jgi:hypothetical protein
VAGAVDETGGRKRVIIDKVLGGEIPVAGEKVIPRRRQTALRRVPASSETDT